MAVLASWPTRASKAPSVCYLQSSGTADSDSAGESRLSAFKGGRIIPKVGAQVALTRWDHPWTKKGPSSVVGELAYAYRRGGSLVVTITFDADVAVEARSDYQLKEVRHEGTDLQGSG
jgi:hypothetical protein